MTTRYYFDVDKSIKITIDKEKVLKFIFKITIPARIINIPIKVSGYVDVNMEKPEESKITITNIFGIQTATDSRPEVKVVKE